MAKTRLNQRYRDMLMKHAASVVEFPELKRAVDDAYKIAAKHVLTAVEKRFPKKDMKVLRKYGVARGDTCIQCADLETARVFRFNFRTDDNLPDVPDRYCSTRNIGLEPDATAACVVLDEAEQALVDAVSAMKRDFRSLFASSATIEDVIAVWPEANAVAEKIGAGSTAVVSAELVERVKSYSKAA